MTNSQTNDKTNNPAFDSIKNIEQRRNGNIHTKNELYEEREGPQKHMSRVVLYTMKKVVRRQPIYSYIHFHQLYTLQSQSQKLNSLQFMDVIEITK